MSTFPYPLPPERPDPARRDPAPSPPVVPLVDVPGPHLGHRLLEQRTVVLQGRLDRDVATRVAAELMSLDAESAQPVGLLVNSPGGPVAEAFAVLDAMALMRAPVATTCLGLAAGTAAAVVAAGTAERRAAPHARLSLRCADDESFAGRADDLTRQLAEHERLLAALRDLLARATRLSPEELERELRDGTPMTADAARARGLVDEVGRGA